MKQTRNTVQRKLVLEAVQASCDHPSADDVYERVRAADPHISRGTVYRNLNLLAAQEVILRLPMPVGPDHFDARTDRHYHFCCRACGRVMDTTLPYREDLNCADAGIPGAVTEWHRLVLVGLCPDCAARAARKPS